MTGSTIFVLVGLIYILVRRYRSLALLHPGLWYSGAWLVAILCYLALEEMQGVPVFNQELLENLLTFVLVGGFLFFILAVLPLRGRDQYTFSAKRLIPKQFGLFAFLGLTGAVINWAALGAPLGYEDELRQQWLQEIPVVTARMWYLYMLAFPASMVAGRSIGISLVFQLGTTAWQKFLLSVPVLAGLFWSMGTGGRQAFGFIILYYIVGAVIAIAIGARQGGSLTTRRGLKIALVGLCSVALLALFIGLTGQARAKQQNSGPASEFDQIWYLAPFGQFIAYNGLAIATHQAYGTPERRNLSETGPVSLAGLQNFGLRLITGWRAPDIEDTNPERALITKGFPLASGTRNVFYDLQADFGYSGAMVAVGILVTLSHLFFVFCGRIFTGRLLPLVPLASALLFWGYSHQFSLLMFNTFFWLAVSCWLWDLAGITARVRRPGGGQLVRRF